MTDITTTGPIIARSPRPLRLDLLTLAIGNTVPAVARAIGRTIAAMAGAIAQAFEMAYCAPYQPAGRRAELSRDEEGRDPGW